MRLIAFTHHSQSFKTQDNAIVKLNKVFTPDQLTNLRWFIVVNVEGRYVPCVTVESVQRCQLHLGAVCQSGITVIG